MNKTQMERLTTKRIANGQFEVYWDGAKTDWQILNGCAGLSGRDTVNIYVIYNSRTEKTVPLGPLRSCKMMLAETFRKNTPLPKGITVKVGL